MIELIGEAKAKEFIFSGRIFDVQEAEKVGLVNRIVSHNSLMEECQKMALELSGNSFNAIISSKRVMNAMKGDLEESVNIQSRYFADCFIHRDQKIGMSAFLKKEKPTF